MKPDPSLPTLDAVLASGILLSLAFATAHMAFVRYLRRTDRRPEHACCRRCELARGRR